VIGDADPSLLQPIELSVFVFDIPEKWFRVETDTRHPLRKVIGSEQAAPPMYFLTQPAA
jgi:hypothetical protein